jgi:hypothetical protein
VKYDRLLASFARLGFTDENTEFLAADNREANRFDGYSWHKALLAHARGRYVIFCHDDIELVDKGHDDLLKQIAWLDSNDPTWLVAGVAGGAYRTAEAGGKRLALHISDTKGEGRRRGSVPCRVEALDECFMLMRRSRPVVSSYDLNGFHYYGPDLCLQAELLGGSAYVIDFLLRHHGQGRTGPSFHQSRSDFIRKYRNYFPGRLLNCTTGRIALGLPENGPADSGSDSAEPDPAT